jgi:hypothetical protein
VNRQNELWRKAKEDRAIIAMKTNFEVHVVKYVEEARREEVRAVYIHGRRDARAQSLGNWGVSVTYWQCDNVPRRPSNPHISSHVSTFQAYRYHLRSSSHLSHHRMLINSTKLDRYSATGLVESSCADLFPKPCAYFSWRLGASLSNTNKKKTMHASHICGTPSPCTQKAYNSAPCEQNRT